MTDPAGPAHMSRIVGSVLMALVACSPVAQGALTGITVPPAATRVTRSDAQPQAEAAAIARALHAGRYAEALAALPSLPAAAPSDALAGTGIGHPASAAELRLLAAVVMDSWLPAASLSPARLGPADRATYWYVQGILVARAAWPGGRAEEVTKARTAAAQLEELTAPTGAWNRTGVRRASILAAIAAAQEERGELTLLLAHALHLDAQLREIGVPDDPVLPADELAGDLWLQVHRFGDALTQYRAVTIRRPERTRAWIGRARAAHEAVERQEAADAARRVLEAYEGAPGLERLRDEMRRLVEAATP